MTRKNFLKSLIALPAAPMLLSACGRSDASVRSGTAAAASSDIEPIHKSPEQWREILTAEEFAVLREEATEPRYASPLVDEERGGTYVCAGCNLPLFSSETKFHSGTGWPSFYKPIEGHMGTKADHKLAMPRTEYHCARCSGHQGHVFDGWPTPTGLRYCNNGVALDFVPEGESLPELVA